MVRRHPLPPARQQVRGRDHPDHAALAHGRSGGGTSSSRSLGPASTGRRPPRRRGALPSVPAASWSAGPGPSPSRARDPRRARTHQEGSRVLLLLGPVPAGAGPRGRRNDPLEVARRLQRAASAQGNDRIVQSWDTASKAEEMNDYSVRTTWREHGNGYYLTDVVSIEDKGSGTHLIQDLRRDGVVRPIAILPEGDKVTRMAAPWRARGPDGPAEARPWRCSNEGRRRRLPLPHRRRARFGGRSRRDILKTRHEYRAGS